MDDLCQAFSWYALSRHLYKKMRDVLQLPSITTLQRVTRATKNMDDITLFTSFFQSQELRSRACLVIADEVYVKASLAYRGGEVFGSAEDQKGKLVNTLLCIMVKCLFTKEKFLAKLIPCHALNADFAYQSISNVILILENCGATVIGLITDNNRVNQSCFTKFTAPCQDTPWIVNSPGAGSTPLFLIYDPVHLIKNIRNNWITEKLKTLTFSHDETKFACWGDLQKLQKHEASGMIKMSKLTESTVNPSNLEKQKVSLVLNVFCDQTVTAFRMSEQTSPSWQSTASFFSLVLQLWKLLNFCKSRFQAKRFNDPDRGIIDEPLGENKGYELLLHWAASKVLSKPGTATRVNTLTKDTASALSWTCHALADLSKFLLETDAPYRHSYVCLGFYQQDDLERHFGHFRMSAGGNFILTTQEVFATHNIDKARFMLQCCENRDIDTNVCKHQCDHCVKPLTDCEYILIDDMLDLQYSVSYDERLSLLYVGGYIALKHEEVRGEASEFREDVRTYLESLNRGGLHYPSALFFDFISLAYIFFTKSPENMCRNRLVKVWNISLISLDSVLS